MRLRTSSGEQRQQHSDNKDGPSSSFETTATSAMAKASARRASALFLLVAAAGLLVLASALGRSLGWSSIKGNRGSGVEAPPSESTTPAAGGGGASSDAQLSSSSLSLSKRGLTAVPSQVWTSPDAGSLRSLDLSGNAIEQVCVGHKEQGRRHARGLAAPLPPLGGPTPLATVHSCSNLP